MEQRRRWTPFAEYEPSGDVLRWQTGGGSWRDEDPRVHVDEATQDVFLLSLLPQLGCSMSLNLWGRLEAVTQ